MTEYTVVIPAAGQGKRMNAGMNKQFIQIENVPILAYTLRVFQNHKACRNIILAIHPDDEENMRSLVDQYGITKVSQFVYGGKERQHSIYNALLEVRDCEYVMVHDGARPFVTEELLNRLLKKVKETGAVIPVIPVKDTIKEIVDGKVVNTPKREQLGAVQTPQAFRVSMLLQANEHANKEQFIGTDDASLVEFFGEDVYTVEGEIQNIKITTREDLDVAQMIVQA